MAGFADLVTCGSVWSCPVCSAKIAARRALEVGAAVALWQATGRPVALVTLTMRHRQGQALADLWEALGYAWARVTSGKYWQAEKVAQGLAGWVRVVEVTTGRNGWHVHVHALLFLDREPSSGALIDWHAAMVGRWSRALVRRGLDAPLAVGQDMRLVRPGDEALGDYFAKAADNPIGREVVWSQGKAARSAYGTVPPWVLLDGVEHDGDAECLTLWHEYERGSKGRRQLTWAQGFRDRVALGAERSDEELAAEVVGTDADELLRITREGWAQLARDPGRISDVLRVLESEGWEALRARLDALGVAYQGA